MDEQRWQGGILRLFRSGRGLDAREVAEELGVGAWMLSRWENGQSKPDWEQLRALARIYGVSVEKLMDAMDYEGTTLAPGLRDAYREQSSSDSSANTVKPFGDTLRRHDVSADKRPRKRPTTRGYPVFSANAALATAGRY